jgi:hypothetical protein
MRNKKKGLTVTDCTDTLYIGGSRETNFGDNPRQPNACSVFFSVFLHRFF